jgi:putative endonuclease
MNASRMRYFVYILASRYKGTLYIGVTRDLSRRAGEHKGGFVPGFTKTYKVHQLVYYEEYTSILEARARERALKRWRREWKITLIESVNPAWRDLTPDLINL